MKFRKLFPLLLLITACQTIEQESEEQIVLKEMCSVVSSTGACPKLIIIPNYEGLAGTNGYAIVFGENAKIFIHNKDELAFIMAHELGHILNNMTNGPKAEYDADEAAVYLIKKTKYRCMAGHDILMRMETSFHRKGSPSFLLRALEIQKLCNEN